MKKIISVLIISVMMLSLSACQKDNSAKTESDLDSENVTVSSDVSVESAITETVASSETEVSSETVVSSEPTVSSEKADTHTHSFAAATCTAPKTCTVCNATEGSALGHTFTAATCTTPKTCSVCKATEGDVAAHSYALGKCSVCGAGDPAAASLLSAGSYGTYEALFIEGKEGQLIRYTVAYNGSSSVAYSLVQYEEVSAAESEIQFEGKHFRKWTEQSFERIENINVTENSLSFNFGSDKSSHTFTLNLEYKDGALLLEEEFGEIVKLVRIS